MSREVKRVPMDFDAPLDKVWPGYLNQHYVPCPAACDGGYSATYRALHAKWYGHVPFRPEERGSVPFAADHPVIRALAERNAARGRTDIDREAARLAAHFNGSWMHHLCQRDVDVLVADGRLMDITHAWTRGNGWQPRDPPVQPLAADVNAWSLQGFGHDSINAYCVIKAECDHLGAPHTCGTCGGSGIHPDHRDAYEAWTPTEPPTGDGWQMWETTSEGSPISPVFATPEELARWLADTGASAFGYTGASYEHWLGMIRAGSTVGSMIAVDGRLMSGVEAAAVKP